MVLEGKQGYDSYIYWIERNKEEINKEQVIDDATINFIKSFIDKDLLSKKLEFSLLDIGCGKGKLFELLNSYKINYCGIDISKEVLNYASETYLKHELEPKFLLVSDREEWNLPLPFDYIVSVNVIQHLPLSKSIVLLRNAYDSLKFGGKFLLYEGRLIDAPEDVVNSMYKSNTCAEHMIPKPISVLKKAAPFKWEGSGLRWSLEKPVSNIIGKFLNKGK